MQKFFKSAVSWASVLSLMLTMIAVCGFTMAAPASAEGTVFFSENFDSYADGTLPTGWTLANDYAGGTASVSGGALILNGRGSDSQTRVFYMGSELADKGDYVFEADYTILESDYALSSSTRWSGMAFRVDTTDVEPYYYFTTRVRTGTTDNEFSIRNSSSSMKKIAQAAAPADQALNTTYHLTVICKGTSVKFYIDDALVFNTTLESSGTNYSYLTTGTIGFLTSNLKISLDNITVSQVPETVVSGDALYTENFDSYSNGTLPAGWTINNDYASGTASVEDGGLVLNGIGSDAQTRVVYLGSELMDYGNYMFEADYTILQSDAALTESTRYSSMMFRADASTYPYYYCTTRVRTGGVNNELSVRENSSTSSYKQLALTTPPAQQVIGETYHLKVICRSTNVQYYIDDVLVFNYNLATDGSTYTYRDKGTIGFTTSNLKVRFDNIVVTEVEVNVDIQPALYDTYIPTTNLINAPSVVTNVTDSSVYSTLTGDKLPSTSLYYLDADLNVTTSDGDVITSLADALTFTNGKIIPALYVKDKATVDALQEFASACALQDAFIVADDAAVLKYAREKMTNLYGVLYTKLTKAASEKDLANMVANTNTALGKTVMVDADYLSKDDVAYLQKRLMNVWVIGDLTTEQIFENIYKGVNGIVTTDHEKTIWIYEDTSGVFNSSTDSTPILIREPFQYAHRGYSSFANQNTMPAFYAASDYGAELIETDVRLTSDGHVVLYHDNYLYTLTNCEDTTKTVENSTLAELMTYEVNDLESSGIANAKIATLREFLEFIDQTDIVAIVEIKNYDMDLVDATAAIIREMGMEDQVVSICFGQAYCERVRQQLPGVSVGWLANANASYTTAESILNYAKGIIMKGNLTYHPNYTQIMNYSTYAMVDNAIEAAAQRGMSIQPWTLNGQQAFDTLYVNGIQGLTTDYLEYDDGYVRKLVASSNYTMTEGTATAVQALGHTTLGSGLYNCIVKRTGGANVTFTTSNGMTTATGTGTATAMLLYKVTTNTAGSYYVLSDLTTITVGTDGSSGITVTAPSYTSLLPSYVAKWSNYISGMNIDVTRTDSAEILTNTTGGYPAVTYSCSTAVSPDDEIAYSVKADGCVSIVLTFADGSHYQLQRSIPDAQYNGEDLACYGATYSGTISMSDIISADTTITSLKIFNVGSAGDEVMVYQLDLVKDVPASMLRGDVDGNGVVQTGDARLLLQGSLGKASLTHKQVDAGDMNGDGDVNTTDARMVLRAVLD